MQMMYLDSFSLAGNQAETNYFLGPGSDRNPLLTNRTYSDNPYPFRIFPDKGLEVITFAPITIFCGSNGSGKSTLLNVIAEKLRVTRMAPFNNTPFFEDYLKLCQYSLTFDRDHLPRGSRIITSDEVFDFLLDIRAVNEGVDQRREELLRQYQVDKNSTFVMRTLDDYEELKRKNDFRRSTKSDYMSRRMKKNLPGRSNGESAYSFFTHEIKEDALYLLDEPENSLSAALQKELAQFLTDSARFYGCQFVISTHSPFLLAMKGAKIYNMDAQPVEECRWTEIPSVRVWQEFFAEHENEF